MVKLAKLIEITDELTEQIVLHKHPNAQVFKEDENGTLRIRKTHGDIRGRIFAILENNLKHVR